jgi:hypothetical protein
MPTIRTLVIGLLATASAAFAQDRVPTPKSILGHAPGDDFYLADYGEALEYFRALDAASDRLQLVRAGETSFGREWYFALVSSAENLRNIERHKSISRRLAWARDLTDEEARALAREGRAIVSIDNGLHATEVAHAQHALQLAYDLVREDPGDEIELILDNVILVLWFTLNPDGQDIVVDWYRRNLGTPYEVSPLPRLYQKYVGHDNNRDGYMHNMIESRVVTRITLEYNPQVFYDHHQTAPFPSRIWIPPFAEPVSSNVHPLMWRWVNVFGTRMAAYLDERGMPGAMHRGQGFDDWYPGFIDNVNSFRNTISFLTETALYRYATPHFYTVNDFPERARELRSESLYASPWRGGWWRLGDAVRYMIGASMSVLDTAAHFRDHLLYNRYQAGRDMIRRFREQPPFAFVLPAGQRDAPTAAILVEKLMINGLEVHEATAPIEINGVEHDAGAIVLLMDQPFAALAKELLEVQDYPDLRDFPGGPPDLPYDVSGWTLPLQMGVRTITATQPLSGTVRDRLRRLDAPPRPSGSVEGEGDRYVLSHRPNASLHAVADVLRAGGRVAFATGAVAGPDGAETGAIVASDIDRAALREIAERHGLDVRATDEPIEKTIEAAAPRLGLYRPWVASISEGWTRWVLEQFGTPPVSVHNADVIAGRLEDRFDVIVIPDVRGRTILEGYRPGTIPAEYAGGIGDAGVESLRRFVRSGGTLIVFNEACRFAIDRLHLPVTDGLEGLKRTEFFCGGALLKVVVTDSAHPLTTGLPEEPDVMFEGGPAFETKPGFSGTVLARYPRKRNPLMSGFLLGPERIQGKAAAVDVAVEDGHVILFGFPPVWRGQSHGSYKFLLNALYYFGAVTEGVEAESIAGGEHLTRWKEITAAIESDLEQLIELNRDYHAASPGGAADRRSALEAGIAAFGRDRLDAIRQLAADVSDDAGRAALETYRTRLKNLLVDLPGKDLTVVEYTAEDLARTYDLAALDETIRKGLGPAQAPKSRRRDDG